ncbi:hypothetical protein EOM39_01495 [Candidatus Gracilibacteria bacterium]|nr:hypothetical protein [Candidatus Gracilibacteria bacterium]
MSRGLNLVQLYELSLQKQQQETINGDTIREKISEKINSIVENRGIDLIYYLWNKTFLLKILIQNYIKNYLENILMII